MASATTRSSRTRWRWSKRPARCPQTAPDRAHTASRPCGRRLDVLWPLSVNGRARHVNRERLGASRRRERHERPWQRLDGVKKPGAPAVPHTAACVPKVPQIAACVPAQIKVKLEQTTRVAAWSAAEDRRLLVQRWQGAKVADLSLPNKTSANCAKLRYRI